MPPKAADGSLESLKNLVQSTITLITQFENNLHAVAFDKALPDSSTPLPAPDAAAGSVDALALAHDSASLVKAHTTKLSLLIINEPFTPSAIAKVLRELVAGPIPATATAVQVCTADTYTNIVRQDLAWRCYRVLKELRGLVESIPLDGKILTADRKNGANGDKGSIVTTGVIWAACDDVILLKKLGIAGLLVQKAEEYKDTLQDVLEELKEWSEEVEEDEEDDDGEEDESMQHITDELQNTHVSAQQMIDDLMTSQRIPRNDPDRIRERLDSCLKRLRLTTLLYSALIQRRIKSLPSLPTQQATPIARRLDEVYPILKSLPHRFGDLACAFYELDTAAIDKAMDSCFFDAFAVAEMLKTPWTGTQDRFTEWADKFQIGIKKPD
ncbi:hypothetical protein E0Z10_g7114 [Xylaria hypoxylon]|uniref:Cyclin-D1-binding protein 1-like N-terminal domain-containing protein n=1 Tax=Xylaria hypoxylon TaxID=37992 RepID=A0A4Z0YCH5_9PEZI|nr:hypothetical protein E0Z10_g7114 [Xylaria hypoxylon]